MKIITKILIISMIIGVGMGDRISLAASAWPTIVSPDTIGKNQNHSKPFTIRPTTDRNLVEGTNQAGRNRSIFQIMGDDISAAGKNAGIILSAPFRFDRKKWLLTFSAVGISALVYTMDEPIRRHTEENRERNWDGVMDWARIYGGGHTWRIVATGSYFGGLFLRQSKIRLMGQMLFESELITIFLVSSLKKILGRSRPYENQGAFRYRFLHDLEGSALPSGHAATAFCLSTVLAKTIGKPEVSIALYGMAAMTAASRIYHDAHWTSDVILGSFIGFAVGNAAVNLHQSERIQIHSRGKTVGIRLLL